MDFTYDRTTISMNYKDSDAVADIMQRLFLMTDVDTAHQRPTYHGRVLIGTMTLQELGFANTKTPSS